MRRERDFRERELPRLACEHAAGEWRLRPLWTRVLKNSIRRLLAGLSVHPDGGSPVPQGEIASVSRRSNKDPCALSPATVTSTVTLPLGAACGNTSEHALRAQILVDVRPMHPLAIADDFVARPLLWGRLRKPP